MKLKGKHTRHLALFCTCFISAYFFCKSQTDNFSVRRISFDTPYCSAFETPALSLPEERQLQEILSHPFYYLAKGAQCYVFASEDNQYVLKLFQKRRYIPPFLLRILPSIGPFTSYKNQKMEKYATCLEQDFTSYQLAQSYLQENTGLMYTHLNHTEHLSKKLTLYDKIGVRLVLDADITKFIIQKRATAFLSRLEKAIHEGDQSFARFTLKEIVSFLIKRSQLGFYDKDPDFLTNFGFIEERPVQIDVGRYRKDETRKSAGIYKDDIIRATDPLKKWLDQRDPKLAGFLLEIIEEVDG
ncbi:MAG: hypothetical protein EBZ47_05760 [Chlamydiae bacterium]|nr:hypothetical protein [Chlamydiota bacterium]